MKVSPFFFFRPLSGFPTVSFFLVIQRRPERQLVLFKGLPLTDLGQREEFVLGIHVAAVGAWCPPPASPVSAGALGALPFSWGAASPHWPQWMDHIIKTVFPFPAQISSSQHLTFKAPCWDVQSYLSKGEENIE